MYKPKNITITLENNIAYTVETDYNATWWRLNNLLHRELGPALIYHRLYGNSIEGNQEWYQFGLLHRLNGPACTYSNGSKFWYLHGQRHRLDGPAVDHADGTKLWYFNNILINCSSQEQFEKIINLKAFW